jgi:hypothetical protein
MFMKKGLIKLFVLFFIIVILNFGTRLFFTEYAWGDSTISLKRSFLMQNHKKFNTVFVGSSLTYYHIIPKLFDSLVNPVRTSSFNFGSTVLTCPETYYITEKLTGLDNITPDYLFIELHNILVPKDEDWFKVRFKYFMDLPTYSFIVHSILHQSNNVTKPGLFKNHTIQFIEHSMNMDLTVNYLKRAETNIFPKIYYTQRGYLSILRFTEKRGQIDTSDVSHILRIWADKYRKYKDATNANEVDLLKIQNLIDQFKQKGTHLIFILQSKSDYDTLDELLALYNRIPSANKINMADPDRFPEFFELSNAFDKIHYNDKGAEIFTKHLAEEFKRLVEKYQL